MTTDSADDSTWKKRRSRSKREPRSSRWVHGAAAEGLDDDSVDRAADDGWPYADEDDEREPGTLGRDGRRSR